MISALIMVMNSCEDNDPIGLDIPETYNFENVDYSGQIQRIAMLAELSSYAKSGISQTLDEQLMLDMFSNQNNPFSNTELNGLSKDLKSKTFELDQTFIEQWIGSAAEASSSTASAENGVAGVLSNGSKTYLFDENGFEPAQIIEKVLMGACFYYQATTVYLGSERMAADNNTIEPGRGTNMEHHWDEAFGYTSFPEDFSSASIDDDLQFWAKYSDGRDDLLQTNDLLMKALLKGRAAISANDLEIRDQAIIEVRESWELVVAATAIHYLNGALADFTDDVLRNHELSEAWAFIKSLTYNEDASISTGEIQSLLDALGDNFYTISTDQINQVKDDLVTKFNLENEADVL
jgi:hypothetical protein